MRRQRFQRGWLTWKVRKKGWTWYYNWREYDATGHTDRTITLGQFKTEAEAWKEAAAKRLDVNREVSDVCPGALITFDALAAHYRKTELQPQHGEEGKAATTRDCYESNLKNWILPHWGPKQISEIKAVAVEEWLRSLSRPAVRTRPARSLARGTKAKIRNIMHALYQHAMRYEFTDRNPIALVRQSAKRERIPQVLDVSEFVALFARLKQRERTMVILDAGSGLRRSELFALQWRDIDFLGRSANVSRSIVHNTKKADRVGFCKTEASRKPVPLDDFMIQELERWRRETEYTSPEDWVFASPHTDGQFPYWPQTIIERFIRPAAAEAGIRKTLGWHTFRHTYATLLKDNGEDVKVVQELLRHANSRITLDLYAQAITESKRLAQARVVAKLVSGEAVQLKCWTMLDGRCNKHLM